MDKKIIAKYNIPGPRYTSYPPATLFKEGFSETEALQLVEESNSTGPAGISLYIHVPFCPRLCHFCGCNTQLGGDQNFITRYFDALIEEIERVSQYIDRGRPLIQVHWGGGTPNSVNFTHIERVMKRLQSIFRYDPDAEIAMECSPAYLDLKDIDSLNEMGFNRISLGIQDFNESVLKIINRKPSKVPVEELVNYIREKTQFTVNLDFVYGLPGQSPESYIQTLQKAIAIKPDRLVTFSYAHVPWVKESQKILEKTGIPGPDMKLEMLLRGYEYLTGEGYEAIGMDHFALPGDELADAFRDHSLHRNFQGYCTRKHTGQVYAFGASSISQLHRAYIQNTKGAAAYIERINKGEIPVERGYILNDREMTIRKVINQVMCNGQIDLDFEAKQLAISEGQLREELNYSESHFHELIEDGLMKIEGNTIRATPLGMLLLRIIAMKLDPNQSSYQKKFSKTI